MNSRRETLHHPVGRPWRRTATPDGVDNKKRRDDEDTVWNAVREAVPSWVGTCLKSCLAVTVALYILNQQHMLPKPLSAVVSKTLFWPSMPITVGRRIGQWETVVDDTVIMGGAPFGFAKLPERLYEQYNVRGVINLCKEYSGPQKTYERLGISHLHLPTVDHFEPTVEDLEKAVKFIGCQKKQGNRVYVHCRAGHGRSAAAVFAWLLSKDPTADRKQLNEEFCRLRDVRKTLWRQSNIIEFHRRLVRKKQTDDVEEDLETVLSDAEL
jgi:atypical dual specificity phosphatase